MTRKGDAVGGRRGGRGEGYKPPDELVWLPFVTFAVIRAFAFHRVRVALGRRSAQGGGRRRQRDGMRR